MSECIAARMANFLAITNQDQELRKIGSDLFKGHILNSFQHEKLYVVFFSDMSALFSLDGGLLYGTDYEDFQNYLDYLVAHNHQDYADRLMVHMQKLVEAYAHE